ncbi:MAG: DHH family phosphoesterase [Desulfovibrio sp.]|jgi:nanoRNase/pAp phosphatase (c-di-AMP/oligoRNAs hydrolase)|nr:DHH family phosphoesterase [Desulfovibrio sp.]
MISSDHIARFKQWRGGLGKNDRWCVLVNADPDALASALALKRLLHNRTHSVEIARINEVTRPDNLAMIRDLRIPVKIWAPEKTEAFSHFAIVDSQPHHNAFFYGIPFSLIIDHHPLPPEEAPPLSEEALRIIRPDFGATSTIMTQILNALRIRPTSRLATALLYGIRTDTGTFERGGSDRDLRAWQWLSRFADLNLLRRIIRSEYLREWLPGFSQAFRSLRDCRGGGVYVSLQHAKSADLLVAVADFFTRVQDLRWVAVSGVVDRTVVVVFRGDGGRDIGRLADACFHDVGTAGGHRMMGRAEFPLSVIPDDVKPADFILQRLQTRKLRQARSRDQSA